MTIDAALVVEVARLLRVLAGPDCQCAPCRDARIAADQLDREVATQEGTR